jgi:predicted nucleic-acid-binding protein
MTGIDTNILLRFLLDDEPAQSAAARQIINEHSTADEPASVNIVVLAEMMWFLRRRLKLSRALAADTLRELLMNAHLRFQKEEAVIAALDAFASGQAEFNDYLIGYLNADAGIARTLTFDTKAARDPHFQLAGA